MNTKICVGKQRTNKLLMMLLSIKYHIEINKRVHEWLQVDKPYTNSTVYGSQTSSDDKIKCNLTSISTLIMMFEVSTISFQKYEKKYIANKSKWIYIYL